VENISVRTPLLTASNVCTFWNPVIGKSNKNLSSKFFFSLVLFCYKGNINVTLMTVWQDEKKLLSHNTWPVQEVRAGG
jgi:hypothetical protein